MWSCGTTGQLWDRFKFFLTNCSQIVCNNHHYSEPLPVLFGVRQRSILGPLLFTICIDDMFNYTQFSKLLLFADDPKCWKTISQLKHNYNL